MSPYRLRSRILEMRYRAGGSQADLLAAIGSARRTVAMYPTSPDEHLRLADMLAGAATEAGSAEFAAEAIQAYQRALSLNDARPGHEIRRWSTAWRKRIQDRIDELAAGPATQNSE